MQAGNKETRQQFTGQVLLLPTGETAGWLDMGDVEGHKIALEREASETNVSAGGKHWKIGMPPAVVGLGWEFTLREGMDFNIALGLLGARGADSVGWPTYDPGFEYTGQIVSAQKGYTYFLGLNHFYNPAVEVGGVPKVEGIDYAFNGPAGTLRVIPSGSIANGATIDIEAPAYGRDVEEMYDALSQANAQYGVVWIYEKDQHAGAPRVKTTANVQYWIDTLPDHDGKKPATRKLRIMAREKAAVVVRTLKV